jgi:hypothetical protein
VLADRLGIQTGHGALDVGRLEAELDARHLNLSQVLLG